MARRRANTFSLTETFTDLRSDYRASKDTRFQSRLTGVDPMGSGADYHYRNEADFLKLRERIRDYQRNDGVVGQGLRRVTANVVQDGFTLDVKTGSAELDRVLSDRWYAWAEDPLACDSEGVNTFAQMERLSFQTALVDGDVFALLLSNGAIQWIEAHRVRTPGAGAKSATTKNVVNGILLDEMRRRVECWITRENANPLRPVGRVADMRRVPFRDEEGNPLVLQVYESSRFSQTRGVSALAPVSETVGIHDDLQFAALVKQQIGALIAILRQQPEADGLPGDIGTLTTEQRDGYIRQIEGISAGMDVLARPGEKIEMFSSNVPGAEFFKHATLILTFIAVNLDLPLAVLLLDPSNTNFSGWRGAIDQARMRFRQMQRERVGQLHKPVYEWKVRNWLRMDDALAAMVARLQRETKEGVDPFGHQWNPPSWQYIEPLKDASGDALAFGSGLNSLRRIHAARGREWLGEVAEECVEDVAGLWELAIAKADQLNRTHAEKFAAWGWNYLHPQQFVYLPKPQGVDTLKVAAEDPTEVADAAA